MQNKEPKLLQISKVIFHYLITTFKNSKDVSKAILEFIDPFIELKANRPSLMAIRIEHNLEQFAALANETTNQNRSA